MVGVSLASESAPQTGRAGVVSAGPGEAGLPDTGTPTRDESQNSRGEKILSAR
jgi:hypothetical protein